MMGGGGGGGGGGGEVLYIKEYLSLNTHFSAYMRRVAFIIISNEHTLSLFLTSKDSLV